MAGYAKIADLMTEHSELATFQRFDFLSNMNILFLQAELVHLEDDLRESMKEDLECGNSTIGIVTTTEDADKNCVDTGAEKRKGEILNRASKPQQLSDSIDTASDAAFESIQRFKSAKDWYILANMGKSTTWDIVLESRVKLQEYAEAVQQRITMNKHTSPNSTDVKFLRRWLTEKDGGNYPLDGLDRDLWKVPSPSSLVALRPRNHDDPLNSIFLSKVSFWWHSCIGHRMQERIVDQEAQYRVYQDRKILRISNILSSVISSVLLVGSVVILAFVKNLYVRLGVVALFTQLFSLALVLVTNARKVEMFGATAAFVAVQVVYVGSSYTPES